MAGVDGKDPGPDDLGHVRPLVDAEREDAGLDGAEMASGPSAMGSHG